MKPCNACGKCCTKYGGGGLSASAEEIDHWREFHPDTYRYVASGNIWADPETGLTLESCPFLYADATGRRQLCKIYDHRPEDCRLYPSSVDEMILDGCEMIELKDRRNPRQAAKDLNELMADSRLT